MTDNAKKEEIQTTEGSDSVLFSIIAKLLLTVILAGGALYLIGI